ncbi:MAG: hypothetical protein FD123_2226 [Bacteroidetes bacterium]|nr:MAG: hypothetical protein FD123_2226 [Bacteroidota bacterium]
MERNCLSCGESMQGRADKKFCSDQCRNTYNNRHNGNISNYMRNVNNMLRRNRRILHEMNPNGKITVHKDKLTEKGFNFKYITHCYTTKKKDTYFFVYDMGYLLLERDFVMIVARKPEDAITEKKKLVTT